MTKNSRKLPNGFPLALSDSWLLLLKGISTTHASIQLDDNNKHEKWKRFTQKPSTSEIASACVNVLNELRDA